MKKSGDLHTMGEQLNFFYSKAEELGGLRAKIKLSLLTKVSSTQANALTDTNELINKFEQAMVVLKHEFTNKVEQARDILETIKHGESSKATEERLRKNIKIFTDLITQRALFLGNVKETSERITEAIVEALELERASTWFYNNDRTQIECIDLYIRSEAKHSSGIILKASDFPTYFKAIETEKTIAAHNAHTDPRTSEFSETYLKPLGINSMLDVPIWAHGKMIGVVCHEHVGSSRIWLADEENFAFLMSNFVSLAVENSQK